MSAVDVGDALKLSGVRTVLTGADISVPPIPVRVSPDPSDLSAYLQPVLAWGHVRYGGEPVAVAVADDPYLAEDGADLVAVDYAELAPVRDARAGIGHHERPCRLPGVLSHDFRILTRGRVPWR